MKTTESKTARLSQIETLLLKHSQGLTQAEIARKLGVHRSTIMRNLADMQAPIYEEAGRIHIDRSAYLFQVRFNLHEALSIHLAARMLAAGMDRQNPHAAAALRKLSVPLHQLAPHISRYLSLSADSIDEETQWQDPEYLKVLETLTQAWADCRKVAILFHKAPGEPLREFLFEPYYIEPAAIGRSTYVFGLRTPPGELRTFKIERIERAILQQETYTIPEDFDPRKLLADAWGIWYTGQEPVEVVLKFSPKVASRVEETRWHRSEQVTRLDDGSLIWKAKIAEPLEMLPWVRGWGADVEIIKPAGLRESLAREVNRMVEIYGKL